MGKVVAADIRYSTHVNNAASCSLFVERRREGREGHKGHGTDGSWDWGSTHSCLEPPVRFPSGRSQAS